MNSPRCSSAGSAGETDSVYAWVRLAASTLLCTIGAVGMWSFVVVLPTVQAEFAVARTEASLPFTLTMVGFAFGSVMIGRVLDRFGTLVAMTCGAATLAIGFIGSSFATGIWPFALLQGMIGFGSSAMLGPLVADISHWFTRRRGIAVAICSAGNTLGGAVWPPIVQHFITTEGWRATHIGIGVFCALTMAPLAAMALRRSAPAHQFNADDVSAAQARGSLALSSNALMILLVIAGFACCVAMAMPQVHIVAYCGDLGYGPARGAEMLALMMGMGVISRVASGWIADRIGGLNTLLVGSVLQGAALMFYMMFDGLASLYVISALFGLFQGGIVPSYAIIVREYFPSQEAGTRVGLVLMSTLFGMALGGWMSGVIFDLTGSYQAAFLNGVLWNVLHAGIVLWLVMRLSRRFAVA